MCDQVALRLGPKARVANDGRRSCRDGSLWWQTGSNRHSCRMGLPRALETDCGRQPLSPRVLVGFDGSRGTWLALDWARREALARGVRLRVVKCSGLPALVPSAAAADLLVLGTDGGSGSSLLRRSLGGAASRRSPCPVVVVRGSREGPVRRIVVGVDGSSAAGAAVDWACEEATIHGADLWVVHAVDSGVERSDAQCLLDLAIAECRERTDSIVVGLLIQGSAGPALIALSRDADLVAIGSRGRSGFKTALFGSVAVTVAEHADCPVAVTHPTVRTAGQR